MPYNFSGQLKSNVAKLGVVFDGELFTVADGYGYTVTSTLSPYTAFANNAVRSATGVWSVTMKDSANRILDCEVRTVLSTGNYLGSQLLPFTTTSNGALVINWVFNNAGTPTDLPSSGSPQFLVYVVYSESAT